MYLTYWEYLGASLPTEPFTYALAFGACVAAGFLYLHSDSKPPPDLYSIQSSELVNKDKSGYSLARPFGEWNPQKFSYPKITPQYTPLSEVKQIAYRPFRPGPHHVTMGIRSMDWDSWVELDREYETYQRIRKHRIQTRGKRVLRVLNDSHNSHVRGGELAAIELVHELAAYLAARYPEIFNLERHNFEVKSSSSDSLYCDWGWGGASPIKSIKILPTNDSYELPLHVMDGEGAPERALEIAAMLVQDDLAIMMEGDDGKYYFQAGAICVAGFWRIEDKIGMPLEDIHISGDVPQYREKLQASMERFFRRMAVDKPVVRNNYFIQVNRSDTAETSSIDPEELAWSSANGPEVEFQLAHAFDKPLEKPKIEELRLRTERQSLRRLGRSGAIIFTIRTYLVPIAQLAEEKGIAGRMAGAIREWPEDVKEYKGGYRGGWWDVLLDFLEMKEEEEGAGGHAV
ncbi:hypothetical protein FA15DRAFT_610463 [Coprinopsis marcescibilis]|uniref:Uncharacterized protein n=1 Tax=Coprinopsis marcescibilis TaxID=230819 RepID=A0A5C3L967_COPMA|nr:hypothetical protein FA15DRAFT_610463 [Coprinopsis marcescibilis]